MEELDRLTDEAVVKLVYQDRELFAELVRRYQDRLRRYVGYLVYDRTKVEDIVQETLIKAFVNLKGFNTKKRFSCWIYRIAHNEAVNGAKRYRREVSIEKNEMGDYLKAETDLEAVLAKKEESEAVSAGMAQLPLKYREPVALYYFDDKSYEQISDILRLPVNTVGTRIRRGKERLKAILKMKDKR